MVESLGRSHPLVRRTRILRRDGGERDRQGVLLAEGIHLAEAALSSGADIECAIVSPRLASLRDGAELLRRLDAAAGAVYEAGDRLLDSLQDARSPEPVLLLVRRRRLDPGELLDRVGGVPWMVVAFGVQDPGNLGALVRTADACGASGLIAAGGAADLHHPRAVRATAGSIFRLPVSRSDAEPLLEQLRARGYRQVAADPAAGTDYDGFDWSGPLALWLGSEGSGLPREIASALDATVTIPMRSGVESLSVGAAAAVLLYEARKARIPPTSG